MSVIPLSNALELEILALLIRQVVVLEAMQTASSVAMMPLVAAITFAKR
jgi:hypothetical protein